MAKAPRPGVSKRQDETETGQALMRLTINRDIIGKSGAALPRTFSIGMNNIPMREQLICRKATGFPVTAFWEDDRIGMDSLMVLWWMARRLNGDFGLTFDQAADEWPLDLRIDEMDIESETPDGPSTAEVDDPEA